MTGRTLTAGEKGWQYDFVHGDVFERLTFVLPPTRTSCDRLVVTFTLR